MKEVIHLSWPRKIVVPEKSKTEKTNIEYSHRFEVMGHWRRVKGIGKNNIGERNQEKRTWVVSHEKGPKDKPFIKQIREMHVVNS